MATENPRRHPLTARLHALRASRQRRRQPFMTCPSCGQWSKAPVCEWCDFDAGHEHAGEYRDHHPSLRRRWVHLRQRLYAALRGLGRFDVVEHTRLVVYLAKWVLLGSVVGILAGLSSAFFLVTLDWATRTRLTHPWLIWFLPLAGFAVGLVYHYAGGRSAGGNNLIIDEIHEPRAWIPGRMAPLIYGGTILTQLFGGSAGREGTALQMSGSLTDLFSRLFRIPKADRRILLIAALAGGFGAVFGVPIAGCVFALEVQAVGRVRYDALVPALSAAIVGNLVVKGLGVKHALYPPLTDIELSLPLLAKVIVAGLCFGLTSVLFGELTHGIKRVFASAVRWPPARPLIGGFAVIALTMAVGDQQYNGLSLGLIGRSLLGGVGVATFAFLLKLLFTAVTLGSGFQGGEVTPLFVIGATLGATLGHVLGVPVPLMASLGFVAVFAGAANVPLACTVMGIELFGSPAAPLLAVACVVSYVFSSHRGIYGTQRIDTPKGGSMPDGQESVGGVTLNTVAHHRRHWLPATTRKQEQG